LALSETCSQSSDDPHIARVLIHRARLERTRQFGPSYLELELRKGWNWIIFEQAWDGDPADVPSSCVAALLAINRLCAPGSELAVEQRWYTSTALDDPWGIEEGKVNDSRLYRCLDRILPHQTKLERRLKERYGALLGVRVRRAALRHPEHAGGRRGGKEPHEPGLFAGSPSGLPADGDRADCQQ
jgi:hypothetical protein